MLTNIDLVGVIVWAKRDSFRRSTQNLVFCNLLDKEESLAITPPVNPNALPKDASMIFLLMFG
jgi:hypothetical protein